MRLTKPKGTESQGCLANFQESIVLTLPFTKLVAASHAMQLLVRERTSTPFAVQDSSHARKSVVCWS